MWWGYRWIAIRKFICRGSGFAGRKHAIELQVKFDVWKDVTEKQGMKADGEG